MNLKHLLRTIIQYKYVKIFKNYNNILINIIDSLHLDVIQVNLLLLNQLRDGLINHTTNSQNTNYFYF